MNAERLLALFDRVSEAPDAVPKLRRFVLDLALQGKLVEQFAEDESPHRRLELARSRLCERAAVTGRLRWKPSEAIHPSELHKPVPEGWTVARVNDTGLYINGLAFKPADWKASGIPIIRIQNLTSPDKEFNYADGEFPEEVMVQPGDLLVSWSATLDAFVWDRGSGVLNQHIFRVLPATDLTEPRFLHLLLRRAIREMAESEHAHGLAMMHINRGPFLAHLVLIPPLAEQHRIVARVDELMALCDQLETARADREHRRDRLAETVLNRLDAPVSDPATFANDASFVAAHLSLLSTRTSHADRLRATILELAVKGRLGTQDPADATRLSEPRDDRPETSRRRAVMANPVQAEPLQAAYSLPETWCWVRLADLTHIMDAGWSPQCESHPRRDVNRWGVLKTTAVQVLQFDQSQHKELPEKLRPRPQFEAKVGDILVTRAGPKNRVGIVCVVAEVGPRLMISDKLIRIRVNSAASPEFVALALNAGFSRDCVEAAKSGMAVMQMNISQDKLKAVPIPLPPLAEQHRIVARVDELMALCDQLEASLAAADTANARLLDAILHEALNGPPQAEAA